MSALNTAIQGFRNRSSQMNITQEERKENIFFTTVAFEEFIVRVGEKRLNATAPEISIFDHNVGE